jgi:chromosome segregation ATPase
MSEQVNSEFEAAVEELLGGEVKPDHSPETDNKAEKSPETPNPHAPETEEEFIPYGGDEYGLYSDSAEPQKQEKEPESAPEKEDSAPPAKEPEPAPDVAALQEEIANYKKRLHDTQKAMHEANTAKAELQKQLDSLKKDEKKDDDDDNWFADDDDKETVGKIEKELAEVKQQSEELKNQQQEYQQELRRQQWLKDADELSKQHSDFDNLVYERLEPLLDETTGDPMIRALYMKQEDRSPAGAYEFAKKLFGYQDKLDGKGQVPPAEEKNEVEKKEDQARGKAGLDRMNSADFAEDKKRNRNVIEDIFG